MPTLIVFGDSSDGNMAGRDFRSMVYSDQREGPAQSVIGTTTSNMEMGQSFNAGSGGYRCIEQFHRFDTSALPGVAATATLQVIINQDITTVDDTFEASIHAWGPTLTIADWVAGSSLASKTIVASLDSSTVSEGVYLTFTDVALAANVSPGAFTELIFAGQGQRLGSTPTGSSILVVRSADQLGTTDDPKLTVTYTISAALSGVLTDGALEAEVRVGSALTATLANETWVASGATFDAQRQSIIDGLLSDGSYATGWNTLIRATLPVTAVVRTSSTVVTITLPATPTYNIHANETVTVTVPGAALTGGNPLVATPTIAVTALEELMAWRSGDRVKETTTTTGTGNITLAGAVSGFQAFSAICSDLDLVAYAIVGTTEWEVGLGTWNTGNVLTRTRVLQSSNSGALVSFSAGSKDVFCTFPAGHGIFPAISREQVTDVLLPAGASIYVVEDYEIGSGKELEIGSGAAMEIG